MLLLKCRVGSLLCDSLKENLMLTVRKSILQDAVELSRILRDADRMEIEALGRTPLESLSTGVNESPLCFTAVDEEGVPSIIWGSAPSADPDVGYVWLLASDGLKKNWVQLLRETPNAIKKVSGDYKILANACHSENKVHIRWLKWSGFTILREVYFNGNKFYEFAKLVN